MKKRAPSSACGSPEFVASTSAFWAGRRGLGERRAPQSFSAEEVGERVARRMLLASPRARWIVAIHKWESEGTMKIFNSALVLAIAVVAVLVPFSLSAHEQVGAYSLNVTHRCQTKSVIVAQADCRNLCVQRLAECRAVRGPNDRACQFDYTVCISSCP